MLGPKRLPDAPPNQVKQLIAAVDKLRGKAGE
jgi:hypothetical protein